MSARRAFPSDARISINSVAVEIPARTNARQFVRSGIVLDEPLQKSTCFWIHLRLNTLVAPLHSIIVAQAVCTFPSYSNRASARQISKMNIFCALAAFLLAWSVTGEPLAPVFYLVEAELCREGEAQFE